MGKSYRATLVSHTHWDRAWYVTFQEFRARLVRLVDRLIDLLRSRPEYGVYMLDGQMIVLEDYLEVRPGQAAALADLCRSGRIGVGPWYVLADEFLASPESLVRNLMLGHRLGADYGGVMRIGYVPDGFGHVAQLPQILRGFDIDNAFFWRGMGAQGEQLGTEFEWQAPDGSSVTAIWMPFGYHNLSNVGYPIHWGDTSQMAFDAELAQAQIEAAVDRLKPMGHTRELLLMNGIDHAEAEPRIPQIVARANYELADTEVVHGTLAEHLARVRASGATLPAFSGEFRWGRYSEILQGVYATRIHLKQLNHRVETLLERYAEPLAAMAWLAGAEVPAGTEDLLWTAWRWLLKNHPHDDLYGSGIDAVHEEMRYRFAQAEQIAQVIVRDSLRQVARQADMTAQPGVPLLVYNPLARPRRETVSGAIDLEFDSPLAADLEIVDNQGQVVLHQVLSDEPAFWMETLKANRKRRVHVAFIADVPAWGYRTYYARPRRAAEPWAQDEDWQIRPDGAENHYLAFTIAADGGLDVVDKASGSLYRGLHHFYDVDDAGDEYSYCSCAESETVSTVGGRAEVRLISSGPCQATFEVARTMAIPARLTRDRRRRTRQRAALPIISKITLYHDRPGLYIETHIVNRADDHKLSVVFPTDLQPAQSMVDAAFAVMARDIDLPESEGWVEDPTPLMHQRAFTDLSEDGRGLAIVNRGLPAVEVTRTPTGAQVALILLRSVGWLSRDDLPNRHVAAGPLVPTPGAQCHGEYSYEYAIMPHAGDWRAVYPWAYAYTAPLLLTRADTHEGLVLDEMNITRDDPSLVKAIPWPRGGPQPGAWSLLRLSPDGLELSAVRRAQDGEGLVVRYYNIERAAVDAQLTVGSPVQAAYRLNLNEERQEQLLVRDGQVVEVPTRGAEVVTVELRPARCGAGRSPRQGMQ